MSRVRLTATSLLFAFLLPWISSCNNDSYTTLQGAVWNTTYTIKYRGDASLADSIHSIMRQVETSLSPFNPASRISAINNGTDSITDALIDDVFDISFRVNKMSHGAFDPTLSPLINLWGFGYKGHEPEEPSDSAIMAALEIVGIAYCHISDGVMHKKTPDTTFNFSAVTKGYGCDLIADMFLDNGVTDFMIEIGGELVLRGVNPDGDTWRVMIDAPVDSVAGHTRLLTIDVSDCGVATSGNYRNFHDTAHGRIGHTISTTTGRPVNTCTLSATVIAPTCAVADALATACMAMNYEQAINMIDSVPHSSCLLVINNQDSLNVITSRNFPLH